MHKITGFRINTVAQVAVLLQRFGDLVWKRKKGGISPKCRYWCAQQGANDSEQPDVGRERLDVNTSEIVSKVKIAPPSLALTA